MMSRTKMRGTNQMVVKQDLEAMATAGMTPAEIARYFGLTRQGLAAMVNQNPELKEAFSNGLHHVLVKCVNVLLSKVEQGDTFAAIYLLNNRFGWMEAKYRKEKEIKDIQAVTIYLPDNNRDNPKDETIIEG